MKLVSIVMTTYNGEKFIRKQLDSIVNQTYKNLEIIICDDCSSDNTIDIIKAYQKKDKRIKLYINEKNLGFTKNFEKAISLCNGDYIALADQDDIWRLNKIEVMIKNIDDAILVYGDEKIIDENDNIIANSFFEFEEFNKSDNCYKKFLCSNYIPGHNMMFKKELILKIIPIPKELLYHDMWITILAAKNGNIKYIDKTLGYYRQHTENISRKKIKKRNIFQKIFNPIDWNTYVLWNKDRIKRIQIFKKYFPEDKKFLDDLENYYSHKRRMKSFLFALKNIDIIVVQKGFLRKLKYVMLPLFAPKVYDE